MTIRIINIGRHMHTGDRRQRIAPFTGAQVTSQRAGRLLRHQRHLYEAGDLSDNINRLWPEGSVRTLARRAGLSPEGSLYDVRVRLCALFEIEPPEADWQNELAQAIEAQDTRAVRERGRAQRKAPRSNADLYDVARELLSAPQPSETD